MTHQYMPKKFHDPHKNPPAPYEIKIKRLVKITQHETHRTILTRYVEASTCETCSSFNHALCAFKT